MLFGGCDSELGVPYQPWVRAFGHLLGSLPDELLIDDLAPELSEVAVILPQLDRFVPGLLRSTSVDPEIDRYRLFGAVDAMLAKASTLRRWFGARRPAWAGAQTLALLRHLARSGSAERLLLIGAFRDTADEITEPLASCLADLRRLDGVVRLRMDGFDRSHVERFVAMATSQDLDADMRRLAATVARRTAGNPFYVGELWRHLVATGAVVHSRNRWVARTDAGTVGVPESVREVVGARLARLSGPARGLIELVAVAGQRIELRVLALAAELSEPDLVVPLDELVEAGLLDAGGSTFLTYEFPMRWCATRSRKLSLPSGGCSSTGPSPRPSNRCTRRTGGRCSPTWPATSPPAPRSARGTRRCTTGNGPAPRPCVRPPSTWPSRTSTGLSPWP